MRVLSATSLLLAAACGAPRDLPRDSVAFGPRPVSVSVAKADSSDLPFESGPPTDLSANDPWLAVADSAIHRHLQSVLFSAPRDSEFAECADDEGSDNPPIGAVAVSARPIRRAKAQYEPFEMGHPMRSATYEVEVKSVAILVPQGMATFPRDTTVRNADQFEARVGLRTDTFSVSISQRADSAGHGRWEACAPTGPAVSDGDGPGFWFFYAGAKEPDDGIRLTHWVPTGASWARIVALADSARRRGP